MLVNKPRHGQRTPAVEEADLQPDTILPVDFLLEVQADIIGPYRARATQKAM